MASVKRRRVSKKNKLSWRKHVDIKDVEDFLEDKRLEERLGDRFDILPDKALFTVDTKPVDTTRLSAKQRKRLIPHSLPKCFSMLQPLTKVPDPLIKRNRVKTKEERMDRIAKKIEESRRLNGIVKAKDKLAAQNRILDRKRKIASRYKIGDFKNDIWNIEDFNPIHLSDREWLTNDTIRHTHHGLGKLRKRIPKSVTSKTTLLQSVEHPHPGMSYNPSLKDHQSLLSQVGQKELEKIKEEKHIERVTVKMFKRVTADIRESSWLKEMSEGIPDVQKENLEEIDNEGEYKSINPPVRNVKKDQKSKRKQKEQRQLEKLRLDAKTEKKKVADIYKLKKLKEQIEHRQKKVNVLKEKRAKKKQYQLLEPKKLSKVKFETPDLEFNMGDEISGDLRTLKTEGNLLRDRFKSLQKRNILEPTAKQPPRKKAKVKKYERASHKMGWEPKGF